MATVGTQYNTASTFEIDQNGTPLAGGMLYFFLTGTDTPLNVYADPLLTTPLSNPVIADANGRFGTIWLSPSQAYDVQLFSAATPDNPTGVQIWALGPIGPAAGGAQSNVAGIIGEVRDFAGPQAAIPGQWYMCYGQAFSRTTYAALFAVIGTTWGAGDGSTTFNLPDLRGRATFGVDNMGGSPANRVTSGVSGVSGVTLGASGGDQHAQEDTLDVNASLTDPGHTHSYVTPPGDTEGVPGADALFANLTQPATTGSSVTGMSVSVTVASTLIGASQNMPPAAMVLKIIYAGA